MTTRTNDQRAKPSAFFLDHRVYCCQQPSCIVRIAKMPSQSKLKVGILGATGAVGQRFIQLWPPIPGSRSAC